MVHACVRTDNMSGTTVGKDLVTLRYFEDDKIAEIENGTVLEIGDYLEGEREVRKGTAPTSTTKLAKCALIASEEVVKDKNHNNINEFINLAGANLRGYRFVDNDCFSLTKEAFPEGALLEEGATVVLQNGTKFNAVAEAGSATVVGKIVLVEGIWYVVEVTA